MKKIYFIFAIAFSIALFLLSPGLKADASDVLTDITITRISGIITMDTGSSGVYSYYINGVTENIGYFALINSQSRASWYFYSTEPGTITYTLNTVVSGTSNPVQSWIKNETYTLSLTKHSSGLYFGYTYPPQIASCSLDFGYTASTYYNGWPNDFYYDEIARKLLGGPITADVNFTSPEPTYTLDSSLGYLKGLGKYYKEQTVASQSTNLFGIKRYVISDRKYIFGWDAESTSGVQLSDENISVNVKVQLFGNRSTLSGETVPIKCNGTIVDFGNVPASAFYYSTSLAEFLVKFDFSDTNDLNGDKKPIFYFRLERKNDDNTVTYGNTLKFDPSAPISYISDSITSSPEGTITVGDLTDSGFVVDGSIESETVTGQGISGSSWEEITINSNMNFVQDNSMITNIESFLSQIGSIPRIVGVLFSFLPSWCLGFVGLGLGMLVTVLVVKVVRG